MKEAMKKKEDVIVMDGVVGEGFAKRGFSGAFDGKVSTQFWLTFQVRCACITLSYFLAIRFLWSSRPMI